MKCIDVSDHQGVISVDSWEKIKKVSPYCMIRSSYTKLASPFRMEVDAHFKKNIENAIKAGMIIGIYHFSQALNSTESAMEAKFTLKTIKRYKKHIKLPVAFDCETNSRGRYNHKKAKAIGKTGMLNIVDDYCNVIKDAGYEPMLYANLNELNNYISNSVSNKYKIWVAQYSTSCDYRYPYFMWQYSSKAKIPGVKFNTSGVDMSYIYIKRGSSSGKIPYGGTWPTLPSRGYFKKGDKGTQVKHLQKLLNWVLGINLDVDGEYGDYTRGAVLKFERKYGLSIDGEFGKECLATAKSIKK